LAPWFHSVYTAHARIVAGLTACSASLPRKSKHGHTWPPPRARVGTVRKCLPAVERQVLLARQQRVFLTFDVAPIAPHQPAHTHGEIASTRTGSRSAGAASGMLPHLVQNCARRICLLLAQPTCRRTVRQDYDRAKATLYSSFIRTSAEGCSITSSARARETSYQLPA
jgi:hypothetical protein